MSQKYHLVNIEEKNFRKSQCFLIMLGAVEVQYDKEIIIGKGKLNKKRQDKTYKC